MTDIYVRGRRRRSSMIPYLALVVILFAAGAFLYARYADTIASLRFSRGHDIVIVAAGGARGTFAPESGAAGFAECAALARSSTPYHTVIDLGSSLSGSKMSAATSGDSSARSLSVLGVDIAVLSARDSAFSPERLAELSAVSGAEWISAAGPYPRSTVRTFGNTTVAFIAASVLSSDITAAAEECRASGASRVVLLFDAGPAHAPAPKAIASAISQVDAVLDGTSRTGARCSYAKTQSGEYIPIIMVGRGLNDIGCLVISDAGGVYGSVFSGYDGRGMSEVDLLTEIDTAARAAAGRTIGRSSADITRFDENGVSIAETSEIALGDMTADACRIAVSADMAFVRGTLLRADILRGDITFDDIINVCGDSTVSVMRMTGREMVQMLERTCVLTKNGGREVLQVSGASYSIGEEGVTDVMIGTEEQMVPIESNREYRVAVLGGDKDGMLLYEAMTRMIEERLQGDFDRYAKPAGRIKIK